MPEVSVIIPTYNGAKFIVQTINSVLAQDFDDFEIIIVNDGTTDNTVELIKDLSPKINIVTQENQGIAMARNTGIRYANGQYYAFLDHDDIWHPGKLSAQLQCFKNNTDIAVVFGTFIRWQGEQINDFFTTKLNPEDIDKEFTGWIYHKFLITNWVLFSSALFKASAVHDVGFFNPELPPSDDWDFIIRISRKYKVLKMNQAVVLYRTYDGQTSRQVSDKNTEIEFRQKIINKYGKRGKHGEVVDVKEINFRFFKSHFYFGHAHLKKGSPDIAINSFYNAIKYRPFFIKSYIFFILGVMKKTIKLLQSYKK